MLLCRRNGLTGCGVESQTHQAADEQEVNAEFIDVVRDSRVGKAISFVNSQRKIFQGIANDKKYFDEEGTVQKGVFLKTIALALELEVDESKMSQGNDRAAIYLETLQNA